MDKIFRCGFTQSDKTFNKSRILCLVSTKFAKSRGADSNISETHVVQLSRPKSEENKYYFLVNKPNAI